MDYLVIENRPEHCSTLGLDCGSCTRRAALSVASICPGLDSRGLFQIFVGMYPSEACHPMASDFELAYREAGIPACQPILTSAAAA